MLIKFPLILLSMVLFASCHHSQKGGDVEPLRIEVASVRSDTILNRRSYIGTLASNYEAVVQPRVNGYLIAKRFANGMPVRKGQLIFQIDPREQQADLLAAQAALSSAKAKFAEAANNYARATPLVEIDAISQSQYDQYKAEYLAAEAAIKSAEQSLENARLTRGYTDMYASIDGVISSSSAHIGDYVGPSSKFPTLTVIQNIDTVCVDVAIPMREYLQYSGQKSFTYDNSQLLSDIKLYLADGALYPLAGQYSYTKSSVADAMGTIIIVVVFPNPDYLLKPGQFARVEANLGRGSLSLTVPQSAVSQVQNINSLWVIDADSTARFRNVELGEVVAGRRVILDGVEAGEQVAVDGNMKLRAGMKVVPQIESRYE